MFRRLVIAALALVAAASITTASAQRAGGEKWVLLETRKIDFGRSSERFDLTKAKGTFRAIRVNSNKGGILISKIQVRYGDGRIHSEDRTINLLSNERTRPVDQRNEERFVDLVTIDYKRGVRPENTELQIWGLQSTAGARAARRAGPATSEVKGVPTPSTPTKAAPGEVTAGGDVLFGVQNVGLVRDRDVIRVGAEIGQFDRLRMRVLENDIFINTFKVVYADGSDDTLVVNAEIKRNTRTRWFAIKGDKFIKEIQMTYRSRASNLQGQARIEVYGDFASGWLGPNGRGKEYNQGWVLLGAQTATRFLRNEIDTIPVGRNEGGFKRIRVSVKDRALVLDELRVRYGNNEEDIVSVKTKVDAGSTYGPIDLKGGTRVIKEIRARYRSAVLDRKAVGRGAAVVEIWGQH